MSRSLSFSILAVSILLFSYKGYAQFSMARALPGCIVPINITGQSCDADPSTFAVNASNELIVNNIAGNTCCLGPDVGGDHNSFFEFPVLTISDFMDVMISMVYMSTDAVYEDQTATPLTICQNLPIDNTHDQIRFTYSINGGPEVSSLYVHGINQAAFTGTWMAGPLNGNTLRIRVYVSNNDINETFIFKNLVITGTPKVSGGPDDFVCPDELADLNGEQLGTWSGGLGTIANPDIAVTTYDMIAAEYGTVIPMTYTGRPAIISCLSPTDMMNINVLAYQEPTFVFPDFCVGDPNGPTSVSSPGGLFSFAAPPVDGASIKPETGQITGATGGTNYFVQYTTLGPCQQTFVVIVQSKIYNDPSFEFEDFCIDEGNLPINIATSGGTFGFMPDLGDGAVIDPITGIISNAVTGNTYFVQYSFSGDCPKDEIQEVYVKELYEAILPSIGPFCLLDPINAPLPTLVDGIMGNWFGPFVIDNEFTTSIAMPGTYDIFFEPEIGQCAAVVSTQVEVISPPRASLGADLLICPGECKEMTFNFIPTTGEYKVSIKFLIDFFNQVDTTIIVSGVSNTEGLMICYGDVSSIMLDEANLTLTLPQSIYENLSVEFNLFKVVSLPTGFCTSGVITDPSRMNIFFAPEFHFFEEILIGECDYDGDGIVSHSLFLENVMLYSINNGPITIEWYYDMALTMPITDISNFQYTEGTIVYFKVISGYGCGEGVGRAIGQIKPGGIIDSLTFIACENGNSIDLPIFLNNISGYFTGPNVENNQFDPTGLAPGKYQIFYRTFADCILIPNFYVIVNPNEGPIDIPLIPPLCEGIKSFPLPTTINGYSGAWSGPFVSNGAFLANQAGVINSPHTITFSPNPGNKCLGPNTIEIEVIPNQNFDPILYPPICKDGPVLDLGTSINGIEGSWSGIKVVDNMFLADGVAGVYKLKFTPKDDPCYNPLEIEIEVILPFKLDVPNFGSLCVGSDTFLLPTLLQSYQGTWYYANQVIDKVIPANLGFGTFELIFEPSPDQCAQPVKTTIKIGSITAGTDRNVTLCKDITQIFDLPKTLTIGSTINGTWLKNGNPVIRPDSINSSSLAVGLHQYLYVINDAICGNDTSIFTIDLKMPNDAGPNISLSFCSLDAQDIDLFTLVGTTDMPGVWRDKDGNTLPSSTIKLTNLNQGSNLYSYFLPANGCNADSARVDIQKIIFNTAGDDINTTICLGNTIDLMELVTQEFKGGTIINASSIPGLTGNIWTTTGLNVNSYSFQYAKANSSPCPQDTAILFLDLDDQVYAGDDVIKSVCDNQQISIFELLSTNASAGGNFYQNGQLINTNILSSTDTFVQLLYVVGDGVVCPRDSAFIDLTISARPSVDVSLSSPFICEGICENIRFSHDFVAGTVVYFTVKTTTGIKYQHALIADGSVSFTLSFCSDGTQPCTFFNLPSGQKYVVVIDSIKIPNSSCQYIYDELASFDINKISTKTLNPKLCLGQFFVYNNNTYDINKPSGIEIIKNPNGCDSVISIALTFYQPSIPKEIKSTTCNQNFSLTVGNTTFNKSNPKGMVLLSNVNGCDSIINVDLTFADFTIQDVNITSCDLNFRLMVGPKTFDNSNPKGSYTFVNGSIFGCDSIVNVDIKYLQPSLLNFIKTTCDPTYSCKVGNTTFNKINPSGEIVLKNAAVNGCDSLILVRLTFADYTVTTIKERSCDSTFQIKVGNITFDKSNASGRYTFVAGSVYGCDSIVEVAIEYLPTPSFDLERQTCDQTYTLVILNRAFDISNPNGQVVIPAGSIYGCDSIVNVNLRFVDFTSSDIVTATCDTSYQLTLEGKTFNFNNPKGQVIIANGSSSGCDSIVNVSLTYSQFDIVDSIMYNCSTDQYIYRILYSALSGPIRAEFGGFESIIIQKFPFEKILPSGNYQVKFTSDQGCEKEQLLELLEPNPLLDTVSALNLVSGGVELTLSGGDFKDISWSPAQTLSCDSCMVTIANPVFTTEYNVSFSDEYGCTHNQNILVVRDEVKVEIPNIFSPNGDQKNDYFYIQLLSSLDATVKSMVIYDRWGNLMFNAKNKSPNIPNDGWDGTFYNTTVSLGVYVYFITLDVRGKTYIYSGDLTIIK